jgi:hypothetical protein
MRNGKEVRLAALIVGALVLWACDEESDLAAPPPPTPTLRASDYGAQTFRTPRNYVALGRFEPLSRDVSASRVITPSGGDIVLREAGVMFRVPPGALSRRTRITMRAHAGQRATYTFEPHGLQFTKPAEIAQLLILDPSHDANAVQRDLEGAYLPHGISDLDASGAAAVAEVYPVRLRTFRSIDNRFVPALATFRIAHFSGYMLASSSYTLSSGYMLASGRGDTTSTGSSR